MIEIPYCEDTSRISNSSLGWFIKEGPYKFYQKLNREISEDTSSMRMGRMIHMYLLQNDDFFKEYAITDAEAPKSAQQKEFCMSYISDVREDDDLKAVDAFKSLYSTKGMSADKIAENALILLKTLKPYIEFLELIKTKEVIRWSEYNRLKIVHENVKLHKKASQLLFNTTDEYEVHNEFRINWIFPIEYEGFHINCKSLIDRLIIKKDYSEVILVDIKTTGNVYNFKESLKEYDYCRQMSYYWAAIDWYLENEVKLTDDQISKIKKTTYIIAVGSNNEIKVFNLNHDMISERFETISNTIKLISWHLSNNLWDFTKEYYEGDGDEVI